MTEHLRGRSARAGHRTTGHTADAVAPLDSRPRTPQAQPTTVRVLAVLLAVMTGVAAALAAYIIGDHVTAGIAEPIVWAAATFVSATGLVLLLEDKTGLTG